MFHKLQQKFTLMNMLVLSLMMLISFCVIYFLIYSDTQNAIRRDLMMLSNMGAKNDHFAAGLEPMLPRETSVSSREVDKPRWERDPQNEQGNPPVAGFMLIVDSDTGEIIQSKTFIDMQEIAYEDLLQIALDSDKKEGKISADGYRWAFRVDRTPQRQDIKVSFLETSAVEQVLANLIKIFVLAAVLLLFVIWLISRSFAKRAIRPVQEAFDRQTQFISDASHELKTPVAVIQTNLDLLVSHGEETVASQKKWTDNINLELTHMQALTGKLLYLTRLELDEHSQMMQPVNLSGLVQTCVLPMEAVYFEKQQKFTCDIFEQIWVKGNADELSQVLHILLENAHQYTPQGGQISIRLYRTGKKAVLSVSNSGPGIAPEDQAHVFRRFYRADKSRSRKSGGYGLGLPIAQRIVQQHQGTIHVMSVPDEFTTFSITFAILEHHE